MEAEGQVVLSTWHIGPEISIEYCVRLPSSQSPTIDSNPTDVADVFVSLNQAVKLLTLVSGSSTAKVKPPNFKTVWTISLDGGTHLDLCPLTDFVYHAALKAPGKRFKRVWEGILTSLVVQLRGSEGEKTIVGYTQVGYTDGEYSSNNRNAVKTEEESECNLQPKYAAEEPQRQFDAKVEVKVEEDYEEEFEMEQDWTSTLPDNSYQEEEESLDHEESLDRQNLENDAGSWSNSKSDCLSSFKCKVCDKTFVRLMVLINHCKKEHPDQTEACPEEPTKLGLLETLHERTPDIYDNQFVCGLPLCDVRFERFLSLVDHERTHSEAFICILCGECLYSAENLIVHMDSNHGSKSEFICRVCGFFNRRADTLRTHVQQEHMQGAVLFQCEQCPYSTEKKQSLHHHKRTVHSAQEEHYCDQCGKNYASSASLYAHKRSHDPDHKRFACKLCPAKFAYSSGLSYHMAVHTGEKPFQCGQCGSSFGSGTALSRHKSVVHAEEKDMVYQCEHCGKNFPKRMGREYKDHVKIHTGERDHICQICGSSYFSRKMLRKHELKKHPHLLPKKATPVKIDPESVPQLTVTPKAPTYNFN